MPDRLLPLPLPLPLPLALVLASSLALGVPPGVAAPSDDMARIPGGAFDYGTDSAEIPQLMLRYGVTDQRVAALFLEEVPRRRVTVASFLMDRTEVTTASFARFVAENPRWAKTGDSARISNGDYLRPWAGGRPPARSDSLPVTFVTWFAATSYCASMGKRLPTEVEWEYAARGGLVGETFPWGPELPTPSRANYGASGIDAPVDVARYPANRYGLFDMAGNVWEFVADRWTSPRAARSDAARGNAPWSSNAEQAAKERVVIRGGSFGGGTINLRVRYRDSHPAGGAAAHVGFRCAKDT